MKLTCCDIKVNVLGNASYQIIFVVRRVHWVDFLVILFAHVLFQYFSTFEDFFTENANQVVQLVLQNVQELGDVDEVVGLANAEVMIERHVV